MEKFKAGWSNQVRIMTIVMGIILLLCLVSFGSRAYLNPTNYNVIFCSILTVLILAFAIGCIIYSPRYLTVDKNNITIKKLSGKITIPVNEITTIERRTNLGFDSKKFGSGGFFGYNGYFVNDAVGRYTGYVTDQHKIFWVITPRKKYTLSCDDPDRFVSLVKNCIG
ncbi:MAG: PH domain-containing protein [Rikenellaceae bacterium]|nr:PH domain-containing protein [Rikenellaceae bacterium]